MRVRPLFADLVRAVGVVDLGFAARAGAAIGLRGDPGPEAFSVYDLSVE